MAVDHHRVGPGLLAALAGIPDPRQPRGVRHPIMAILAPAVCAVLAGACSFTAIGEWVADDSRQVRDALGLDTDTVGARYSVMGVDQGCQKTDRVRHDRRSRRCDSYT
ncbi:transposase family protein [Amycolatopsis panacis]|uniref:Transposase family protein n=1 Tax=Amycolatopsis panacis TaxID=2340917 RepID=A0A419IB22_9PSEU|nr:transposase family protein [Amycolatopsis panacis]RJQ91308.1 transposase family protein [Amycolatopsis panacis]